jgi:hypothetical protein
MFEPQFLYQNQIDICTNTISTNAFYLLVGGALVAKKPLSIVRMADGEQMLMKLCRNGNGRDAVPPPGGHGDDWLKNMGCYGITKTALKTRLEEAANTATYFGPSLSGIVDPSYSVHTLFNLRDRYVDGFFCNAWTEEMKITLFKTAGRVLFIHRNPASADAMQIRAKKIGVPVTYIQLAQWQDAEDVVGKARNDDAPLVLFSAGPASKFIGPRIATSGFIPKVTLDIGNAADYWLLSSLN